MTEADDLKEKRRIASEKRRQKLLERGSNRLAYVTGETKNLEAGTSKPSGKGRESLSVEGALTEAKEENFISEREGYTSEKQEPTVAKSTPETDGFDASVAQGTEASTTQSPALASLGDEEEWSGPRREPVAIPPRTGASRKTSTSRSTLSDVFNTSRLVVLVTLAIFLGSRDILWSESQVSHPWMQHALSQPILVQFLLLNGGALLGEMLVGSFGSSHPASQRGVFQMLGRAGKCLEMTKKTLDGGALFFFLYVLVLSVLPVLVGYQSLLSGPRRS